MFSENLKQMIMNSTNQQLKLTPTEQRIFDATADGQIHSARELLALVDDHADYNNLQVHICNMRKKLLRIQQDIVFQSMGRYNSGYRRIILLSVRVD